MCSCFWVEDSCGRIWVVWGAMEGPRCCSKMAWCTLMLGVSGMFYVFVVFYFLPLGRKGWVLLHCSLLLFWRFDDELFTALWEGILVRRLILAECWSRRCPGLVAPYDMNCHRNVYWLHVSRRSLCGRSAVPTLSVFERDGLLLLTVKPALLLREFLEEGSLGIQYCVPRPRTSRDELFPILLLMHTSNAVQRCIHRRVALSSWEPWGRTADMVCWHGVQAGARFAA